MGPIEYKINESLWPKNTWLENKDKVKQMVLQSRRQGPCRLKGAVVSNVGFRLNRDGLYHQVLFYKNT